MDTGRARTFADALSLKGQASAFRTAAACKWLATIKNGYEKGRVSHSELMELFNKHPGIGHSSQAVDGAFGISQSLLAAIHYLGSAFLDKEPFAAEFVNIFITGNSYDGCAAHAWRERIVRMKASQSKIGANDMLLGSIHSWNLFSSGKEVKQFRIPESVKMDGLKLALI